MNVMRTIRIGASAAAVAGALVWPGVTHSAAASLAAAPASEAGPVRDRISMPSANDPAHEVRGPLAAPEAAAPMPVPASQGVAIAASGPDAPARERFAAGLRAMGAGNDDEARETFDALSAAYPQSSGVATNQGIVAARHGRRDDAIRAFERATLANPSNAIAWTWLGSLYRAVGRPQDALLAYRRAIAARPDYAPALLDLGILYDVDLHDPAQAANAYRAYLTLRPDRAIVFTWLHQLRDTQPGPMYAAEAK